MVAGDVGGECVVTVEGKSGGRIGVLEFGCGQRKMTGMERVAMSSWECNIYGARVGTPASEKRMVPIESELSKGGSW